MFCSKCGKEIEDDARFCQYCGSCVGNVKTEGKEFYQYEPQNKPVDKSSFLWGLLGFIIPIIGLILYLVWKDESPLRAKSCGVGALIRVAINVVASVLVTILSSLGFFYFFF